MVDGKRSRIGRARWAASPFLRRGMRHPLLTATALFLLVAGLLSIVFYLFEVRAGSPPPYDTYLGTVRGILILVLSGFDIEPPTSVGAFICGYLLMASGIVYIGLFTAIIAGSFVEFRLRKGITVGKINFSDHILLCGWVRHSAQIVDQLFASDLKVHSPVVMISPDAEEAPRDYPLLKVIRGDPTETAVLEQANAREAKAAIVLANHDSDPSDADARSLLIALAIETLQPEIYSCVEVLNPQNAIHFHRANVDEVISVTDIGNSLIVQAALNPGISRFISGILTFGDGDELYRIPAPAAFIGRTFLELSEWLISEHNMVLVGTCSNDSDSIDRSKLGQIRFSEGDNVFVLAEDQPENLD
jgi:voltage-gated potassium channel